MSRRRPDGAGASDTLDSDSSSSSIPHINLRGTRRPRPGQAVPPEPVTPANHSSSSPATVAVHSMPPVSLPVQPLTRASVESTATPTYPPPPSSADARQRRRRERAAASSPTYTAAAAPSLLHQQVQPRQPAVSLSPPPIGEHPRRQSSRQRPRARSLSPSRSRSRSPSHSPPQSPKRYASHRRQERPADRPSRSEYHDRRDRQDFVNKSPSSAKWKTPLLFLGSVAAATFCVDRFWPRGSAYDEKEAWGPRDEDLRHYDRDRVRERVRPVDGRAFRDSRDGRREVVVVDERADKPADSRPRRDWEDERAPADTLEEYAGDRRRVRRMNRSGYVPPPPVNMTAPTPPQMQQPRGVTFQQDPRGSRGSRELRDPRDPRDIRGPRDPREFRDLRDSRDIRYEEPPANDSVTSLREQRRARTSNSYNNSSRRATWDPSTAALAAAATVGTAAAVSSAVPGSNDDGRGDVRRRRSARDAERGARDQEWRDYRDPRDTRERAAEANPRWSLYSQGNTPLNLQNAGSRPGTREASRTRDADVEARPRRLPRERDERPDRDERRAGRSADGRRFSRPGHAKDAPRFDGASAAAVAATAALASDRDARETRPDSDDRSAAPSQRPPLLTRTSPPSASGEFPRSKVLHADNDDSPDSLADSTTDSGSSDPGQPARRPPPAPVDESSESLHVYPKTPRYPSRRQRGPPADLRMSGALGNSNEAERSSSRSTSSPPSRPPSASTRNSRIDRTGRADRKLSFGSDDDVITVEYEHEPPAPAPARSRIRPDRSQETIPGSLKSALKGGGERLHPDVRRSSGESAASAAGAAGAASYSARPVQGVRSAGSHVSISSEVGDARGGGGGDGRAPVNHAGFDDSPPSSPRRPAVQKRDPVTASSLSSIHSDSTRSADSRGPPPSSRLGNRRAASAATATAAAAAASGLSAVSSRRSSHSSDSDSDSASALSPNPVRPRGGGGGAASVKFNDSLLSTRLSDASDSDSQDSHEEGDADNRATASQPPPLIVTVGPPDSPSGSDDNSSAASARRDAAPSSTALVLQKDNGDDGNSDASDSDSEDSFTVRNRYKMIKLRDRLARAVSSVGGSTRSPSPSLASTDLSASSHDGDAAASAMDRERDRDSHGALSPPLRRSTLSLGQHSAAGPRSSSNTTPQSDSESASHVSTVDLRDAGAYYRTRRNAAPSRNKSEDYLAYGSFEEGDAYSHEKKKPAYSDDSHSDSARGSDRGSDRDTVRDGSSVHSSGRRSLETYSTQAGREAAADERFRARQAAVELDRSQARLEKEERQRDWELLRMRDKASMTSRRTSGSDSDSDSVAGGDAPRSAYAGQSVPASSAAPSSSAASSRRRAPSPAREPKSRMVLELEKQERKARLEQEEALGRAATLKAREQHLREADLNATQRTARQRRRREIDELLERDYD